MQANGRTALMLAVMYGRKNVVEQLLRWEADPQILDEAGHSVDVINFVFNKAPMYAELDKLLTQYRKEHNLPEYKSALSKIGIVSETNDEGELQSYRITTGGNNCLIQ